MASDFAWTAAQLMAGRAVLTHSAAELPVEAEGERAAARTHPGAYATLPLRAGTVLIGAITTRWTSIVPEWTQSTRARLVLVAQIVSMALHRRLIEREVADGRRLDALLSRISRALTEAEGPRLDDAIRGALQAIAEHAQLDRVRLRDIDALAAGLSDTTHEWPSSGSVEPVRDPPLEELPLLAAALHGGRAYTLDIRRLSPSEAPAERRWLERLGLSSVLVVPMQIGDCLVGSLMLGSATSRPDWSDLLSSRMQLASELFANAVHRRRILRSRLEHLHFDELLGKISSVLLSTPGERIDEALGVVLAQIVERFDLVRATLVAIDQEERSYRVVQQAGIAGPMSIGSTHPILPSLYERVLAQGYLVFRTHEMPDSVLRDAWDKQGAASIATVVMGQGQRRLGLITMVSRDAGAFAEGFARQARLFSDVLGSSLARRDADIARRSAFDELTQLKRRVESERDYLREEIRADHDVSGMVVSSPALLRVLDAVDAVTSTRATVLIRGETGVGKELIARAIHGRSPRADAPLVKVNCAGIPRDLFESEFFGHVRGSFTGAHRDRAGRFELADKGTLFLDEIGEIPLELQAKLLRVLQEGEFQRVGDDRVRKVDVRILAATNRDLERDIEAGLFRSDLYYRLSVFPIDIPPLRERPEDILPLAEHYLSRFAAELNRSGLSFSRTDEERLVSYPWSGNVRELSHVIERAVILSVRPPLRIDLALPRAQTSPGARASVPTPPSGLVRTEAEMRDLERANLVTALEQSGWRVGGRGGAAELLRVRPSTLRDRMRAFGIAAPARSARD